MLHLAAKAPCRCPPLSSNVRPRSNLRIVTPSIGIPGSLEIDDNSVQAGAVISPALGIERFPYEC
jgi:hypothetical protein